MELVLWLFSFIIFWGYAIWYIYKYGVPKSWSDTYYNKGGYRLTAALWSMAFPMLPIVLEYNHNLMFPVLAAIVFIGAAPAFKSGKLEYKVHMAGSYIAVILGTLAIGISYNLWFLSILILLSIIGLQFVWKPKSKIMWIESIVIGTGHLVVLFKDVL